MEADYANKWQMYETKIVMLTNNFKKVKQKLEEVTDKWRTLSVQASNRTDGVYEYNSVSID